MECRPGCGACCIAASIEGAIPGMPRGKPAGVRCVHLDAEHLCRIWGTPGMPACCAAFSATPEVCGNSRSEALLLLRTLEAATAPATAVERGPR